MSIHAPATPSTIAFREIRTLVETYLGIEILRNPACRRLVDMKEQIAALQRAIALKAAGYPQHAAAWFEAATVTHCYPTQPKEQ